MIIFFGSPLVDIIANVDHNFLKKYNLKPDNAVRASPEVEGIFKDIFDYNPIVLPGGSVTNSARIFQWVSRKSYPMTFVGSVGDDHFGKIIEDKFREEEIHCHLTEVKNQKTGTCAVLLTEKNRSLVTHLGASKFFSVDNLDERFWNHMAKAEYLYLSAFLIGANFAIMKELVKYFLENKKTVIFNLAASFVSDKYPNEVSYLFENADIVFGNDKEYYSFGNICKLPTTSINDLLPKLNEHFSNKPLRMLVTTRGGKSIFILNGNTVQEFEVTQVEAAKIVDTNGAGDAFVGGFLAQFVKHQSIPNCVKCGMWAAREVIQNHGCNFDNKKNYIS